MSPRNFDTDAIQYHNYEMMNSIDMNNNTNEAVVAQCLLSMSKEPSDYVPPPQCEDPSCVSDEEYHVDTKIEIRDNSNTKTTSLRSYPYHNMIPAADLPNPNQWENDIQSSVQW